MLLVGGRLHAAGDLVVADFEQETYGTWAVEGEAFGSGPAKGTLPGQMAVGGFRGERLVNSFLNGDRATGTLTSPAFTIERGYLVFLIGGGGHAGQTCMNLLHNGEVVRTATGPNTQSGGSEELQLEAWDVEDLKGRKVMIQIVDKASGGWGHINVDHIVQTDTRPKVPVLAPRERTFTVEDAYLVIPIHNGARKSDLTLEVEGQAVRRYSTELAPSPDAVDWYAYFNLAAYQGKEAKVRATRATEEGFALVRQADKVPGSDEWYGESLRPQFHFTQAVGWNNDPNGMVYLDGEWHLYFQHNPVGWGWGNMTWGHAVSRDLVHWEQLPNALFPKTQAVGDCFSGGATVDHKNTAGWKTGTNEVLVAFLTDTGAGESVVYSNDRGRTFTWYEGNPVVRHQGRDPKVIWYAYDDKDTPLNDRAMELGGHWVMAVYNEEPSRGRNIAFHTSVDLKEWEEQSHLQGYFECPELFELPVQGQSDKSYWVVMAADAQYAMGAFDGRTFKPIHEGKHQVHWGRYYAAQTFDNAPDNRRIQIGWVRVDTPGMPFNQTFSFPHEMTLRATDEGVRLFAQPVPEIEKLHRRRHSAPTSTLTPGSAVSRPVAGDLVEVRATFDIGMATVVGLDIGGNRVVYDVAAGKLNGADLKPVDGKLSLQVLVDRTMIETCGNEGRVFITEERGRKGPIGEVTAFVEGGLARLVALEIFELESIWKK